jgi:cobyrinic acid a,c-diamide synthase
MMALARPLTVDAPPAPALLPPGRRIALAHDAAFGFAYRHPLGDWRTAGAERRVFSPLANEAPDEGCDVCWLPGGYPELHAARIADAPTFRAGMTSFVRTRPVHGECGGYMVLGAGIEDADGTSHGRLGLLSHATSFARRRLHLGYRRATLLADGVLGRADGVPRGHEFRYASLIEPGTDAPFAHMTDAAGNDFGSAGGRRGLGSGTFFHTVAMETGE